MAKKPEEPKKPAKRRVKWMARLKRDMKLFHQDTGMKFSTIGRTSIGNARLWDRLEAGGTITVEKADDIYEWMAQQGFHYDS